MLIEVRDGNWVITVPAKVNLFLEILGKRLDGFHDLDSIMSSISLTDQLIFSPRRDGKISLAVEPFTIGGCEKLSPEDTAWDIPTDSRNLVCKALVALQQRLASRDSDAAMLGTNVVLRKGIPAQAGLGGGSADAAATLVGGMLTWTGRYDHALASELAAGLGSDINFFLDTAYAGLTYARCTGRGEIVKAIPSHLALDYVVVHPQMGCSTKAVFDRLATIAQPPSILQDLPPQDRVGEVLTLRSATGILQGLSAGDKGLLVDSLWNRLSGPAFQLNPWLGKIRTTIDSSPGVLGVTLSGSGSAMFAIMRDEQTAKDLMASFAAENLYRTYHVKDWRSATISEQVHRIGSRQKTVSDNS
ncbi:MAG: 4-(cytidine 5'-diphospho)-2-C-methyl-D-erythritol kinase [Planctomycetota bacterium]|nr:4-(cytidine 5'-diphospho)-2-C-methyl-D-erythritol kinase [Planctomycetota bacterium]